MAIYGQPTPPAPGETGPTPSATETGPGGEGRFVLGWPRAEDWLLRRAIGNARRKAALKPHTVSIGSDYVSYLEREGETEETIVLLHGFAASKDAWLYFVPHLPARYRVLVLDLPGHGDSTFRDALSPERGDLVSRLAEALERLEVGQSHLVGNSLGGWVATLHAAAYPDELLTLSLLNPAGVYPSRASEFQTMLAAGTNPLIIDRPGAFERLMSLMFYERPPFPWPIRRALVRHYVARAATDRQSWRAIANGLGDVMDLLPGLAMPTLLLWGNRDRMLDVSSAEAYRRQLPRAQMVVLGDCGHLPMLERPEESARHCVRFLEDAEAVRGGGTS